jgi:hypothetical protein
VLENQKIRPANAVIGPLGTFITLQDLPAVGTRWSARRKAEVVAAVRGELLTLEAVCALYAISTEEFTGWCEMLERGGVKGLRVTFSQHYRPGARRADSDQPVQPLSPLGSDA